jgi:hypothetical protein
LRTDGARELISNRLSDLAGSPIAGVIFGDGAWAAWGAFERKEDNLSHDKSSAKWLECVSIYMGWRWQRYRASTKTKERDRCIVPVL